MAIGGMIRGGGLVSRLPFAQSPKGPSYTPESAFPKAIEQQAGDYDTIMGGYKNLLNRGPSADYMGLMSQYDKLLSGSGPQDVKYKEAPEWKESYGILKGLAETGGLSDADQANLRARGISPIRAVYANAQRNLDRQRALSGGYSANYGAAAARMAREQSGQLADATTNVNAAIAEMVQKGKLAAAPQLGNMAEGKNTLTNQIALQNARNRLDWSGQQANILGAKGSLMSRENDRDLEALRGMTSLYGTTPALVNTYGNQVQNNQQLVNQEKSSKRNAKSSMLGGMLRRGGGVDYAY